jgi:hypothetical protein
VPFESEAVKILWVKNLFDELLSHDALKVWLNFHTIWLIQ